MKQSLTFLFSLFLATASLSSANHIDGAEVKWQTNYDEAVKTSKASSKPILLFFTGSDWCSWCIKLEQESLNTPDFVDSTADKFIFVKLDFPLNTTLQPQITAQNKELQKKFDVRGFPTIVIIDSQGQNQIGVTGYRPGGGKAYANHLFKILNDYKGYQDKTKSLEKQKLSGVELKQLYEKANELGLHDDAAKIIALGVLSEQHLYFQTEKYHALVDAGKIKSEEAIALKRQLLAADPLNTNLIHYQIAVIDFEACCSNMDRDNIRPESVVASLVNYINTYGTKDKENLWRLEMIISQVFYEKNKLPEALKYAQFSLEAAPSSVQPDIAFAIQNIQSKINKP